MSRFNVQGPAGAGAQQLTSADPTNSAKPYSLSIQNVGATPVWVADNQGNLNSSVIAGTPNYGFVLQPNTPPFNDPFWVGPTYVLTSGPVGLLEVKASYRC
jgi:hypothetical protein